MDDWKIIVVVVALFVASAFVVAGFSKVTCLATTKDIGYPATWGLWEGCRIETSPGRWVPLENWREFEG